MSLGPGDFFQALMRQYHVDRYVDVIATHGYPESWGPSRTERQYHDWIAQMQQLIRDGGMGVDFWANEMGYADYRFKPSQASKYGVSVTYNYEHTPNFAATSLFTAETMALASSEVSLTGWYRIDDFPATETRLGDDGVNYHLGLLDTQEHPEPAYFALKFFRQVFDEPVRTISLEQRLNQTVIDVFVKKNGKLVVVGWLRSSEPREVSNHSGMASDRRRAQVSVAVPCRRVSRLRSWDEQGRATRNRARFHSGRIDSMPLTGEHICIGEMNCKR
jgi:hypothetical protein